MEWKKGRGNLMPDLSPIETNDRTPVKFNASQLSPVSVSRYKLIFMIREAETLKMDMLESPRVMKRWQSNHS